jgi:hypothetical protein
MNRLPPLGQVPDEAKSLTVELNRRGVNYDGAETLAKSGEVS